MFPKKIHRRYFYLEIPIHRLRTKLSAVRSDVAKVSYYSMAVFLLGQSAMSPELPGVRELAGVDIAPAAALAKWPQAFAESLDFELYSNAMAKTTEQLAKRLELEKYGAESWTKRR